jgi:hypothetical protein
MRGRCCRTRSSWACVFHAQEIREDACCVEDVPSLTLSLSLQPSPPLLLLLSRGSGAPRRAAHEGEVGERGERGDARKAGESKEDKGTRTWETSIMGSEEPSG